MESQRKMRLFCVACCRRVINHLKEEHIKALVAAEKYADGKITLEEMYAARDQEDLPHYVWATCATLIEYEICNNVVSYVEVLSPKDWDLRLWDHIMYPSHWWEDVL